MKAVIHIGMPKTGTSSIQSFLGANVDGLAAQGVLYQRNFAGRLSQFEYPMCAFERIDRHIDSKDGWVRYAVGDREKQRVMCQPILADLKTIPAKSDAHTAVFSSEHAFAWLRQKPVIQSFHDMMSEVFKPVHYVVYLRDPVSLFPSRYSEGIKRGKTHSMDDLINRKSGFTDEVNRLENWCAIVGRDQMSVRMLDPTFLENGDLIEDFCHVVGIDPAKLERPPRVNESLSAVGAEVLRALNAHVPELRRDGSFNGNRDGFLPEIMERTKDMGRITLTSEQRARIEQRSTDGLERLRAKFFPDRDPLFAPAPERDAIDPAQVQAQALSVLAELLARERALSKAIPSRLNAKKSRLRALMGRARRALRMAPGLRHQRAERSLGD